MAKRYCVEIDHGDGNVAKDRCFAKRRLADKRVKRVNADLPRHAYAYVRTPGSIWREFKRISTKRRKRAKVPF